MRLRNVSLLIVFLISSVLGQVASCQVVGKKVYLLKDNVHQQWCGYKSESAWKSEIESLSAMVVGTAEYTNDRLSTIAVTEQAESGDWIVYDSYTLDRDRKLQSLKRTINVLSGDRSEEQVFVIQDGKATKQSSTSKSLRTGRPVQAAAIELPEVPIITSLQAFPFASLITDKLQEMESRGKGCIPDRR